MTPEQVESTETSEATQVEKPVVTSLSGLQTIAIGLIRENVAALRTVNRKNPSFLGLIESIRIDGFNGAIVVRGKTDPDTEQVYYEICDGLHRFTAAKEAGLKEINVDIKDYDDAQMLETQIMGNIHKVETSKTEYSKALKRMLTMNSLMTESELAGKLGVTSKFIRERLSLNKITNPDVLALIDSGKLKLANAYLLAKLPEEEMKNFLDAAITEPPDQFVPKAQERIKEINDAKRAGKKAEPPKFTIVAHMQKMKDIKEARENGDVISTLIVGIEDPAQSAMIVLDWVLHLDPNSVAASEQEWNEKQVLKAAAKEKATAEKKAKKDADAAKSAAEIK